MPGKGGGDYGSKAVNAVAAAAAAFVTRKAIIFAWTKVVGRKPPGKAEDPEVALGEALAWTVIIGSSVAVARLLATRLVARQAVKQIPASAPEQSAE
jgi:hypothetical protein